MSADDQPLEAVIDLRSSGFRLAMAAGFSAEGDVLGVEAAVANGATPLLVNPHGWPVPPTIAAHTTADPRRASTERIAVMDELVPLAAGIAFLRPPSLVLGLSAALEEDELDELIAEVFASAGLARTSLTAIYQPEAELDLAGEADARTPLERATSKHAGAHAALCVAQRQIANVHVCVVRRKATHQPSWIADPIAGGASLRSDRP